MSKNRHFETRLNFFFQIFETLPESLKNENNLKSESGLSKHSNTRTQWFSEKLENCPTLVLSNPPPTPAPLSIHTTNEIDHT